MLLPLLKNYIFSCRKNSNVRHCILWLYYSTGSGIYWTSVFGSGFVFIGDVMANVKQGNLTKSPQWWKHLKDWKRVFWKTERSAQKKEIKKELS